MEATVIRYGHFLLNISVHDSLVYPVFGVKSLPEQKISLN